MTEPRPVVVQPTLLRGELGNTSWLAAAFLLPPDAIDKLDQQRRTFTPADRAFGDCTVGGGPVFNMPPGWTDGADIPTGWGMSGQVGEGYGPMFYESIVSNFDIVHIRCGMAEYNSLTNFYANMYDPDSSSLANHGIMHNIGTFIGKVAGLILSIPLQPFILLGRFSRWVREKPYSAYYYVSPTMSLYWQTLNEAANQLAVKMGLVTSIEIDKWLNQKPDSSGKQLTAGEIEQFSKLLPDIFKGVGGVDVFKASTRYKRLEYAYNRALKRAQGNSSTLSQLISAAGELASSPINAAAGGFKDIKELMESYAATAFAKQDRLAELGAMLKDSTSFFTSSSGGATEGAPPAPTDSVPPPGSPVPVEGQPTSEFGDYEEGFTEHFKAVAQSGADWISFAVNFVGEVSESMSNSSGESAVAQTINGIVAGQRNLRFGMMGGNLGDGIVATGVEAAGSFVSGIASGAANMLGANVLSAMAGNGFVDIPHVWQESSSEFGKMSYSMDLVAPSAHPLAKFQMMLPLLALMCMTAPLSTGKKSHTSPFLVEAVHRGKAKVTTGLIGNLNISRGGDAGDWDIDEQPLEIKVTWDIVNLSNRVHIPIAAEQSGFFDEATNYSDYITALAGVTLHDQESAVMELKRKSARMIQKIDTWTNSAYWATKAGGLVQGSFLNMFLPPTTKK